MFHYQMILSVLRNLKPIKRYNELLRCHPTMTMATTSGKAFKQFPVLNKIKNTQYIFKLILKGISLGLGNLICQVLAEKKELKDIDYKRIIRYSLFGFCISVMYLKCYQGFGFKFFVQGPISRYWLYALDLRIFKSLPSKNSKLKPIKMMLLDQVLRN